MKTASFIVLALIVLSSCAPTKQLPAAPEIGNVYYDSSFFKLQQEAQAIKAIKRFERGKFTKPTVTAIGITVFGLYCILAWKYDIE